MKQLAFFFPSLCPARALTLISSVLLLWIIIFRRSFRSVSIKLIVIAFTASLSITAYQLLPVRLSLIRLTRCQSDVRPAQPGFTTLHPVELLHLQAEVEFKELLARQSKTPEHAEDEYTRRYGRPPPPGFSEWVQYAIDVKSPIIDDYDIINEGVARFFSMPPAWIKQSMEQTYKAVSALPEPAAGICSFINGEYVLETDECLEWWLFTLESKMLSKVADRIPNVTLLFNFLDEPNVLVTDSKSSTITPVWTRRSGDNIGPLVRKACALTEPKRKKPVQSVFTLGVPFVQDVPGEKDPCIHGGLTDFHGIFLAPTSFHHLASAVPILSAAAPYPFADILAPPPNYNRGRNVYNASHDIDWLEKRNAIYWSGSSTGGRAHSETWRNLHRQRVVNLGRNKILRNYTYLAKQRDGSWSTYQSSVWDPDLYHIGFSAVFQCDPGVCEEEKKLFEPLEFEPIEAAYRYKFLFDVDGNSYADRYYRFLASESVPLKMTIHREWHDDRLIPWYHYIPISQSLEEVPELVRFLATTPEGDRISYKIAQAGKEWYQRALTPEQQGIYFYRLLLEMAWLQNPLRTDSSSEKNAHGHDSPSTDAL